LEVVGVSARTPRLDVRRIAVAAQLVSPNGAAESVPVAMEDECRALVNLPRIIDVRTDHNVSEAITVDITRTGDAYTESRPFLIRCNHRTRSRWISIRNPRRPAIEDKGRPFLLEIIVEFSGPNDDISKAISVYIASSLCAEAQTCFGYIRL